MSRRMSFKIFSRQCILAVNFIFLFFSLNATAGIIHDFDIRVSFGGALTDTQKGIFTKAESFWENLIIGYRGEFDGTGIDIDASSAFIDGVSGTLGRAGPRNLYDTGDYVYASKGVMEFDSADMDNMESSGSLLDVILHEMAHVMGFGTLWASNNLLNDNNDYIGEFGLAGHRIDVGDADAAFVPVEKGGGPGTALAHWDETDFGGSPELMTGWLDNDTTLSLASINAFADLGYVINPLFSVEEVPEPSTIAIFALALLGLRARKTNKI
jgi:hypothetical protein